MKVGILTNEQHTNAQKDSVGSSRIRGKWVVKYWPEAEEFKIGVKYDAIIFQKAYFLEYMRVYDGVKILDLCDPDWVDNKPVIQAAELCDAITVSSQGLYDYLSKIVSKPVYLIPDRVDLEAHREKKVHQGRAKGVVWFGYNHNQQVLDGVIPALKRLGLTLTVISDLPYYPTASIAGIEPAWLQGNIKNVKYDQETVNEEIIAGGDMLLNNRPEFGKFLYKSENKTIIGWALGMPVVKSAEDLERFMEPEERVKEAEARYKEVVELWRTELSVAEYKHAIETAMASKQRGAGGPGNTQIQS